LVQNDLLIFRLAATHPQRSAGSASLIKGAGQPKNGSVAVVLNRNDGTTGPSDRERFGREEAARFLAMLAGAEAARAARVEEPHLRVVPPLGDADE